MAISYIGVVPAHVLDPASLERLCGGAGSYKLAEIVEMLPSLAHFVRGCWVARRLVPPPFPLPPKPCLAPFR